MKEQNREASLVVYVPCLSDPCPLCTSYIRAHKNMLRREVRHNYFRSETVYNIHTTPPVFESCGPANTPRVNAFTGRRTHTRRFSCTSQHLLVGLRASMRGFSKFRTRPEQSFGNITPKFNIKQQYNRGDKSRATAETNHIHRPCCGLHMFAVARPSSHFVYESDFPVMVPLSCLMIECLVVMSVSR